MTANPMKSGRTTFVGNAGEHYVMAELLKRGAVAALAPRNSVAYDILAAHGNGTVRIRVKTKSGESEDWQWNAKRDGEIFRELIDEFDFVILVNLADSLADLAFFVIPTRTVDGWLKGDFQDWLTTPGRRGLAHNPQNNHRSLGQTRDSHRLETYRDAWDRLRLWE